MSMANLVGLRYLDISNTRKLEKMPPRIGNLVNLQTLSNLWWRKVIAHQG